MKTVTRRFVCKNCEEVVKVTYSPEELKEKLEANTAPQCKEDYILLYGVCEGCFE